MKKVTKYISLFIFCLLLLAGIIALFFTDIQKAKKLAETPTDIVVTNISTVEAQIYWKTKEKTSTKIYFKDFKNSGAYTEIEEISVLANSNANNYINYVTLKDLEPNTNYVFKIETENYSWNGNYSFETNPIKDKVQLPQIETGNGDPKTLYLVDLDEKKIMLNTHDHGSWAFDSEGKDYTVEKYAVYGSPSEQKFSFFEFLISPSYATDKNYMIVTGPGVESKDRACRDANGCICMYGYSDSRYESKIEIEEGQTCTIDGQVIETPPPVEDVCCLENNELTYVPETQCSGKALKDVSEYSCRGRNTTINIEEGVGFIEATNIVNTNEVPIDTAKSLIEYTDKKIIAVGSLKNDVWEKVIKVQDEVINGNDFNLESGEAYLVISTEDLEIGALTIDSENNINLEELVGWNLIPSSLLRKDSIYSKTILQNPNYNFINQIALWKDENSLFEYTLRDNSGEIYGESLVITKQEGIFIKIPN